jgi:hypothetical protein
LQKEPKQEVPNRIFDEKKRDEEEFFANKKFDSFTLSALNGIINLLTSN